MRVFIYKRTHVGDPCEHGVFGIGDCMGSFRDWDFDAVLGIGGNRPWPSSHGIAGRLNWVGIGPSKHQSPPKHRGLHVAFKHFCLMNKNGPMLSDCAPLLAEHMKMHMRRWVLSDSLPPKIQREVETLVKRYERCPVSRPSECTCQNQQPNSAQNEPCESLCEETTTHSAERD